jgi:hypothetical protein
MSTNDKSGYISPDNGQGMGLPDKCTSRRNFSVLPCGGDIAWDEGFGGHWKCQSCGTSWGNERAQGRGE